MFRLAYEAQRLRPPADTDDDAGGCCGSATIVTVAVAVVFIEVVVEFVELITGIFF